MNDHKHLGLILDSKLTLVNHISEKVSKALKGVGVIKYLSSYVPVKTLDQIYKMYFRTYLGFFDIIYHTPKICNMFDSSNWMDLIERVQYQVPGKEPAPIRFMRNFGGKVFLKEDGFIGLSNFLKYKMVSLPHILKHLFLLLPPPPLNHLYGTRSENDLHSIKCRTNSYLHSFYPHTVKIWN